MCKTFLCHFLWWKQEIFSLIQKKKKKINYTLKMMYPINSSKYCAAGKFSNKKFWIILHIDCFARQWLDRRYRSSKWKKFHINIADCYEKEISIRSIHLIRNAMCKFCIYGTVLLYTVSDIVETVCKKKKAKKQQLIILEYIIICIILIQI